MAVIRQKISFNLILHYPSTEKGKQELARRVSDIHAAAVIQRLKELNCPAQQRFELLNAVIETAKEKSRG